MTNPTSPVRAKHSHYHKPLPKGLTHIDVYWVLRLFDVRDPCLQHAIKKLLVAGGRGAGKDFSRDVQEAIDSCQRAIEMEFEACSEAELKDPGTSFLAGVPLSRIDGSQDVIASGAEKIGPLQTLVREAMGETLWGAVNPLKGVPVSVPTEAQAEEMAELRTPDPLAERDSFPPDPAPAHPLEQAVADSKAQFKNEERVMPFDPVAAKSISEAGQKIMASISAEIDSLAQKKPGPEKQIISFHHYGHDVPDASGAQMMVHIRNNYLCYVGLDLNFVVVRQLLAEYKSNIDELPKYFVYCEGKTLMEIAQWSRRKHIILSHPRSVIALDKINLAHVPAQNAYALP